MTDLDVAIQQSVKLIKNRARQKPFAQATFYDSFHSAHDFPARVVARVEGLALMSREPLSAPAARAFLDEFENLRAFAPEYFGLAVQHYFRLGNAPTSTFLFFENTERSYVDQIFNRMCRHLWYQAILNFYHQQPFIALQDGRVRDRLIHLIFSPEDHIGYLGGIGKTEPNTTQIVKQIRRLDETIILQNYKMLYALMDDKTQSSKLKLMAREQYRQGAIQSLQKAINHGVPRAKVQKFAANLGIYYAFDGESTDKESHVLQDSSLIVLDTDWVRRD